MALVSKDEFYENFPRLKKLFPLNHSMVGSGKPSGGIQGIFMVSPTDTTTFCGTAFHFLPKTKKNALRIVGFGKLTFE